MMKAFVLAEHTDAARELCAGARTLADEVVLLAIGGIEVPVACADTVASITVPEGGVFEDAARTVCAFADAEKPCVVLAEPTRRVKILVGRLAAHLGTSVITDAMSISDGIAESMYFGGLAMRKLKAADVAVYTVGSGTFAGLPASGANSEVVLEWVAPESPLKAVSREPIVKNGADLTKADVVVAAGRGFGEEGQLELARTLCGKTGAGLGCSRPLTEGVDWLPRETYIGVSGLMLTPKVYVGIGVSGQMQHMVGVNRSQTIFAINKDKNAPIFKQCDCGLVGDIKDVLPALNDAL